MTVSSYEAGWQAERLLAVYSRKSGGQIARDKRYRPDSIKGQMQEIYLGCQSAGVRVKKDRLVELWFELFSEKYRHTEMIKQRSALLKQQVCLARRIKSLNKKIHEEELH